MAKKSLQEPAKPRRPPGQEPGKGVGGRVNPSPKEGRKCIGKSLHLKPPSHKGLVGFCAFGTLLMLLGSHVEKTIAVTKDAVILFPIIA